MTATKVQTLKAKIFATGIHGITGQQIDEGTLRAGTLVKNIRVEQDNWDGSPDYDGERNDKYRFEASTDGGNCWYTQETYGKPAVE